MGCLFSKKKEANEEPAKKEYSWDKRKEIKVEDFILDGLENKTVVRLPGSIGGQQFIVQNCINCHILLLDITATVTIEKCTGCKIILGPVKGSVFLRNCKECKCLFACQQFRTRDCSKIDVFMCCTTQPIIEASYKMRFGCYQLSYKGLEQQFKDSGLDWMNNTWSKIYDFTPNTDSKNWSLVPENLKIPEVFELSTLASEAGDSNESIEHDLNKSMLPKDLLLNADSASSVVPMTIGDRDAESDESCLMLIFHNEQAQETAMKLIRKLQENDSAVLVKTKCIPLPHEKISDMFDDSNKMKYIKAAQAGPITGLQFSGDNCIKECSEIAKTVPDGVLLYVSPSLESALRDIDQFFLAIDMQMN